MTITFAQGPQICITLECEQLLLKRASLSFSDNFECQLRGKVHQKLELETLSPFRLKVLKQLQQVPFGTTLTYGGLASAIGQPKAARAIGTACHYNPYPLFIPCHRVITSRGQAGGFAYTTKMKEHLLNFEKKEPLKVLEGVAAPSSD